MRIGSVLVELGHALESTRNWRLSSKLMVLMVLVAVLPLAVVIWQYDGRARAASEATQRIEIQRAARDTALKIDTRVQERKLQLVSAAGNPGFTRFANESYERAGPVVEEAKAGLANLVRTGRPFDGAYIVNPKGEALLSAGSSLGTGLGSRDFFKTVLSGSPSVSSFEAGSDGKRVVLYGTALRDSQNSITSVILVRADADDIDGLVNSDRGRLGEGSFGSLWERSGSRLSAPPEKATPVSEADLAKLVSAVKETTDFKANAPGGSILLGAQPVSTQPWIYTIQVPESVAAESVNANSRFSWMVFFVAAVGVFGASLTIAQLVARPLKELQRAAAAIRGGDYSARARINSHDELGEVASSVNRILDETAALSRTREERDRLQQQIITLLSEVSSAAEGDLTIEAQVTEGALGSVADAFNYMVGELRSIIANVNETTVRVSSSTGEILAASKLLVRSAGAQAEQIADTSKAVEEMSVSIGKVSENARISAQVASEARHNAHDGLESVRVTIGGMQRIRTQVQQTAKQVKRLGESSQEIGQIIQLIEEMADQTNLLALNAAIQASMAGEHGRGFAVVADEVRRLAERAATASNQISLLVKSIQAETTQAVIAMENSTQEVVEGSRLADAAGQSLERIDSVVSRLAQLSDAISQAAEQQAEVSRNIVKSMSEISEVTQTTTAGSQQTAESVGYLARLADQLRLSVSTFRLNKSEA